MRAGKFAFAALAMVIAVGALIGTAWSQEPKGEGLSEVLTDMLRGAKNPENPAVDGLAKRVPFGRKEMQLSFAPLVKETAPAVVNVYASQQMQVRSPFAGDPFFEQFFGRQMPNGLMPNFTCGLAV